ncbi:leucyl aminopeptidase [Arcobacter sp. FWKO B]|uniref:leucyl aminopeptidase n=1 Tax=Arcobacter sp. FWKO B TaxID=2593672 RepID=UPI0018A62176|nr:leucyl aminopeptidase [Arcobacter sp. FWKO B]QOG11738.1 leucyl aminopeptidase [Arcobacter sp. FWKO B]
MKLILSDEKFKKIEADIEVCFVISKNFDSENVKEHKDVLEVLNFKGEDEEVLLLPEAKKLYVGCEKLEADTIRIAASTIIKKLKNTKFKSAKLSLVEDSIEYLNAIVDGLMLGSYTFDKYKSTKKDKLSQEVIIHTKEITKELKNALDESIEISKSVNMVRDIVNTPPDDFYPDIMASFAVDLAKECKIECKIYDDKYLEEKGMGAMLAVARASRHKPKLIHLTYSPKKCKKTVVLVGKGLTYDSGGLSLKPSDYMATMKSDKSGGSAVLGIMQAVAKLKLPIEVHGIIGAVENMIGGNAYKPDDVLKAKNGTTIEVRNTDAEGRLVLADCLCYAQDNIKDIDYILDFATLTGACVVALGEYTTGIMGHNSKLKHQIFDAANQSGELVGSLPFNRYLPKLLKSEIADICNISSSRYGGAITAGLFLDKFIYEENKDKWVHLDIAGPAYVEKPWGYNPHGASGAGVRLAVSFLKSLC